MKFGDLEFFASLPVSYHSRDWLIQDYHYLLDEYFYGATRSEINTELQTLLKITNNLRSEHSIYHLNNFIFAFNNPRDFEMPSYLNNIPKLSKGSYIIADCVSETMNSLKLNEVNDLIIDLYQESKELKIDQQEIGKLYRYFMENQKKVLELKPSGDPQEDFGYFIYLNEIQNWLYKHQMELEGYIEFYDTLLSYFDNFETVVYFPTLTVPLQSGMKFDDNLNKLLSAQPLNLKGLIISNGKNAIHYDLYYLVDWVNMLSIKLKDIEKLSASISKVEVEFLTCHLQLR
ncbi:hypothetical protein [Risungbinella massiliensis]|uniref:hypothetical protein n=1 Tax=Risungbinella massiliensis TaxID=1329796 RepID=UPI0005CC839B|nr:hypothetical protein [Risungbinella massiliensis]